MMIAPRHERETFPYALDNGSLASDSMNTLAVVDALESIDPARWDAWHDGRNPFISHAFLSGLESTGCLRSDWGWHPLHVVLLDKEGQPIAGVPAYGKTNSHGEFVFDHAWARAYAHYGIAYFPKLLCAVPYSPVTGPRLLAADPATQSELLAALIETAQQRHLSSVHVNFYEEDETLFDDRWLRRIDLQYQWRNYQNWSDFDAFLAALTHKRRKNIRQERAQVERSGVRFRVVHGHDARPEELSAMYRLYRQTFAIYGNAAALTLPFIQYLAKEMADQLVLILGERNGIIVAGAWCMRGTDTLYGRYWGASETIPGLHFETCYYQGIEYCLREGLHCFEPGAQGEHKIARGFLPHIVRSRHWIALPEFRKALARWCDEETLALMHYRETVKAHSPFRESATGFTEDDNASVMRSNRSVQPIA